MRMSKTLSWGMAVGIIVLVLTVVTYNCYVLDSRSLDLAIKKELPTGTPKTQVIQFIQARKPMFLDDEGDHVTARISGRARNLIYRRDMFLYFQFDARGSLQAYSKREFLTAL
jgi:hypothetical protein